MTLVLIDKDYLKAEVYNDQLDPVEPKVTNPEWERFNEFSLYVGHTTRSDQYDQGQLKSTAKNAADWSANPRAKPSKGSRDIRVWDFGSEVGEGDITVDEILSIVKNANVANYYLDIVELVTYWEIADPDAAIPTWQAAGSTWYVPNSYNTDEAGNITTQKTWREWAGTNQTIFDIDGKFYVASFAGVAGNTPTSGIILYLMDLKNIVVNILSVSEFQAIQPTP